MRHKYELVELVNSEFQMIILLKKQLGGRKTFFLGASDDK